MRIFGKHTINILIMPFRITSF